MSEHRANDPLPIVANSLEMFEKTPSIMDAIPGENRNGIVCGDYLVWKSKRRIAMNSENLYLSVITTAIILTILGISAILYAAPDD